VLGENRHVAGLGGLKTLETVDGRPKTRRREQMFFVSLYRNKWDRIMRRHLCLDDAGSGAGAGAGDGTGGAGAAGGAGSGSNDQPFAVFKDAKDFHRRLNTESKAQQEKLAKDLGFESVEAMQEAAKAHKASQDASKSELEKEKAAREAAEKKAGDVTLKAQNMLINAEIKVQAIALGFIDPDDAVALVDRSSITYDDKTEKVTGAREALDALAKNKKHLVGQKGGSGAVGSGSNPGAGGGGDPVEDARKLAEERNKGRQAAAGTTDPWGKARG
jgi:uncharacterized spore protein YtfJ